MWNFIFLYILGLNICQDTGADNSTQMYYATLTIENGAIENITQILQSFASNTSSLQVENLEKTTTCQNVSANRMCTCEPSYRWSDTVCQSNTGCCGENTCSFPHNSSNMCVSSTSVNINGSIVLNGKQYFSCLSAVGTPEFQQCDNNLLTEMKNVYSTLSGFNRLTIIQYSVGSIIASFQVTFASTVRPGNLIAKTNLLANNLSATLHLVTTGIVILNMPPNPVYYNNKYNLTCKLPEALNTTPAWQLTQNLVVFDITNGTAATVTSAPMETELTIFPVTELWSGEYTCSYIQTSNVSNIIYEASGVMDVALLPNIAITTNPTFPRCQKGSDVKNVQGICEIKSSTEPYTVTWNNNSITSEIKEMTPSSSGGTDVYAANIILNCNTKSIPQLICIFRNRLNQTRNASVAINIINENDHYCSVDGDWEDTKAEFTAVLKCINAAGQRQRKCNNGSQWGLWGPEVSGCVNQDVNNVLQSAIVSDIGLGALNENAAQVFSRLQNITNNTQTVNTFANLNASVHVLYSLSQKNNLHPNVSSANDFLQSSSNLLDPSLQGSWVATDDGNVSLAERYLSSVEQLIQVASINITKKTNLEVASNNCSQGKTCINQVLNITVNFNSPNDGNVKTAGFKELDNYWPKENHDYTVNSDIVSTTTDGKPSDSVTVKIAFDLHMPRPRNVELKCVSWNNITRTWSTDGCVWEGTSDSSDEGQCVCSHLSSFAILMSRYPLDIVGLNEITYVGLIISLMSLMISLVIELIVWSAVVKTDTLYLRHTAHINISLCLLVADCCFLASSNPEDISLIWCETFVVLKHFCYLSMFFWMLCLSNTLLHQTVFPFHNLSKKNYLRFSLVLGYLCPFLIVAITFLANNGAEGLYFSKETCWLVYSGLLKGSIHAFVIPVGIIVLVNVFSMLVVIMKLLDRPKNSEKSHEKEKKAALTVMRTVILLTPIFGVTWIFGFAVMLLDLTDGNIAYVVNYAFTLLNTFQGLFILLTTCLFDKLTREALLKHLKHNAPALTTDSSTQLDSIRK